MCQYHQTCKVQYTLHILSLCLSFQIWSVELQVSRLDATIMCPHQYMLKETLELLRSTSVVPPGTVAGGVLQSSRPTTSATISTFSSQICSKQAK